MAVCIPRELKDKVFNAFKSGELSIEKLYSLDEAARREVFAKYFGKDLASFVNGKFEQAMLSRQKTAFVNFIKRFTTATDPLRDTMLKKVENLKEFLDKTKEKGFLEDLVETKFGLRVSEAEAKTLIDLYDKIEETKAKIPEDSPRGSVERLEYGYAVDAFKRFIAEAKTGAESLKLRERFLPQNWWQNIVDIAGITKSLVSSLDDSFIGRQGIKLLLRGNYIGWGKNLARSLQIFGKELFAQSNGWFKDRNDAVMRGIRADILSRPNALNGKYNAAKNKYGLDVLHEEQFPVSYPERLPILGRFFKAAETAFSGTALRMRADLADAVIAAAEKNGVDMLDPVQASAHGKIVASMTGRGEFRRMGAISKEVNVLLFSVRFLKANFDTLTAHLFDKSFTPEARKLAAINTLRIAANTTMLLSIAKMLGFQVEFDPRSTKFGQICDPDGKTCFDITGGMRGLVTLGSRLVPTYHNGEWGFWTKSGTTGKWTRMSAGNFGEQTALDTFEAFFEGKLSPTAGALRDVWKGQNFYGEKPDLVNTTIGLVTPITPETIIRQLKMGNDDILVVLLAEAFGFSSNTYIFQGSGAKWQKIKEKYGDDRLNQELQNLTNRFNIRVKRLEQSPQYQRMDNEKRRKEIEKIQREEQQRIFTKYGIK